MKKRTPPAYLFVSPTSFPVAQEVRALLPLPPNAIILQPRSVIDALSAVDAAGRAVVLVSAADAKHLKVATTLASRLKAQIKSGWVKVVVLSAIEHDDLPKVLKKLGCEEVIPHDVKAKGLKLKLTRLMTLVENAWEKSGKGSDDNEADPDLDADSDMDEAAPNLGSSVAGGAGAKKKAVVKAVAPLKTPDDCWIIRGKAFKHVQNMWIVRVNGPAPSAGKWVKVEDKANAWCWVPRDPIGNPFSSEGAWTFYGRQPENKDKTWVFVAEQPRLTYSQNGNDISHRFEGSADSVLRVARNSRAALRKSAAIAASYDQDIRPKRKTGSIQHAVDTTEVPASSMPDLGGLALDSDNADFEANSGGAMDAHDDTPDLAIGPPAPPFADGKFGTKTVMELERLHFYEELLEEMGPRPDMFYATSGRKACLALMRESAHLNVPAVIWTRGQKFRTTTRISHFSKENGWLGIQLPVGYDWAKLLGALQQVKAQEIFVNANLGRTAIFFKQPLSQIRESGKALEVACPEKVYEVQRRRDLRHVFKPGDDNQACIDIGNGISTYWKMQDISAGGACLVRASAPADIIAKFVRGARIKSISFKIYGREVECAARVAWAKHKPGKGSSQDLSLGVQFEHITQTDREGIRLFVMEENYDYLRNGMARTNEDE